jgi:integrase
VNFAEQSVVGKMSLTIAEQSAVFLQWIAERKRNPAKPATVRAYAGYVRNWITPMAGHNSLEEFNNKSMRDLVNNLVAAGLGPKTVSEIITTTKQIVLSAMTQDGEPMYPRTWNDSFIDLPPIGKQKQPTVTKEQLKEALSSKEKHRGFYAFLAGTGLRIGEALAVRYGDDGLHTCWDPNRAVVHVRTSLWQRKEQLPKTLTAIREVNLDPRLNAMLCKVPWPAIAGTGEFLFKSRSGGPLWESSLRTYSLSKLGIKGFHAFRRYRITRLRELGTPEDILRYWVGHAGSGITDRYSKLSENVQLRARWASQAGLGFDIPEVERQQERGENN